MTQQNKFYLSTYHGSDHAMGHMNIWLSDGILVRDDSRSFRQELKEGDIVLCECEPREGGVYTIGIAKVEDFAEDGVTPTRIRRVLDRAILLEGNETIIDHRNGHAADCPCGAPPKKTAAA